MQIKGWIVKDAQGLETRIDLTEISSAGELDAKLFDPSM
jgi:hypothetical protein